MTIAISIRLLKLLWWLIQINAVIWFLMLGVLSEKPLSVGVWLLISAGFLVAAVLAYVGYHCIYIPLKADLEQQPITDWLETTDPNDPPEFSSETCSLPDLHWFLDQERRSRHNAR